MLNHLKFICSCYPLWRKFKVSSRRTSTWGVRVPRPKRRRRRHARLRRSRALRTNRLVQCAQIEIKLVLERNTPLEDAVAQFIKWQNLVVFICFNRSPNFTISATNILFAIANQWQDADQTWTQFNMVLWTIWNLVLTSKNHWSLHQAVHLLNTEPCHEFVSVYQSQK